MNPCEIKCYYRKFTSQKKCLFEIAISWFERSLYPAEVSGQSCPWLLKLIMSQVVEGTWIHTGTYKWLRGECVNKNNIRLNAYTSSVQSFIVISFQFYLPCNGTKSSSLWHRLSCFIKLQTPISWFSWLKYMYH